MAGSPCLTALRGPGGFCALPAPTTEWRDSAARRWASSGTGDPRGPCVGGQAGKSRPDSYPAGRWTTRSWTCGLWVPIARQASSAWMRASCSTPRVYSRSSPCGEEGGGKGVPVRLCPPPAVSHPTAHFPNSDCPRGRFLAAVCQGEAPKLRPSPLDHPRLDEDLRGPPPKILSYLSPVCFLCCIPTTSPHVP